MLYLGIDQHARQITISLRDEQGDVVQARQVSTQPEKINAFFQQLTHERLQNGESFVAVLEVCGFNDWLIRMLKDCHCHKVILIQPEDRKQRKTDRRDAAALSELLWANRDRLLHGKPVRGLRQVDIASGTDQENRRLTTLRKETGQARTRLVNKVRHILRRHNLQWEMRLPFVCWRIVGLLLKILQNFIPVAHWEKNYTSRLMIFIKTTQNLQLKQMIN